MTRPEPWQSRVMAEAKELSDKVTKLAAFCWSEPMVSLAQAERQRLHRQLKAMEEYLTTLNERIEAF
jgi:hypothetical protein